MKYVWTAIFSIIAILFSYLVGKRSSIRNNGSGADSVRDGINDSANKSERITGGIADAEKSVDNVTKRLDDATVGLAKAIGIVQGIRDRGAKKTDDASN